MIKLRNTGSTSLWTHTRLNAKSYFLMANHSNWQLYCLIDHFCCALFIKILMHFTSNTINLFKSTYYLYFWSFEFDCSDSLFPLKLIYYFKFKKMKLSKNCFCHCNSSVDLNPFVDRGSWSSSSWLLSCWGVGWWDVDPSCWDWWGDSYRTLDLFDD